MPANDVVAVDSRLGLVGDGFGAKLQWVEVKLRWVGRELGRSGVAM